MSVSLVITVVGIGIGVGAWLFPDFRLWLLPKIGFGRFARSEEYEKRILLGEWCVRSNNDPAYIAIWEFCQDHTVRNDYRGEVTLGDWHFEQNCVRIIWRSQPPDSKQQWDNLNRPISSYVGGDNWVDHNCVIARKLPDAA